MGKSHNGKLFKNAFALLSQGRPPVPIARPTQTADPSDIDALVGYRKNRLGRGWRINDERQEQAKNALRHGKRMKGREHMSTSDSGTPGPELSRPIGRTLHRACLRYTKREPGVSSLRTIFGGQYQKGC